jgi:ribosomal protein S12 methylthiotransferase accessory factor
MVQMEFSLAAARTMGLAAGNWAFWRQMVTMALPPLDAAYTSHPTRFVGKRNISSSCPSPLEACALARIALWFADLTRDAVGVPAFRAISPDLCHIKPRFARARLLAPDPLDIGPTLPHPEDQIPLMV